MSIGKKIPPSGRPLVDLKTGLCDPQWYIFLKLFANNALVGAGGTGIVVDDGGTLLARAITTGSNKISITNGDGIAGNPIIDVNQTNLIINESQVTNLTSDLNTINTSLTNKQTLNSNLTAISNLTSATDQLPYFTGSGAAALTTLTSSARTLIGDSSTSSMRTTLGMADGTYTPTLTNVSNISSSTAYGCQYLQVGNTVLVSGKIDITPTSSSSATKLGITLPITSNFTNSQNCSGTASCNSIAGQSAAILGDTTNHRAQLEFISGSVLSTASMYFIFSYLIV